MISIILITYNEVDAIQPVLKNLVKLECAGGKEIIVSDGGSNDGTLEKIGKKYKVVHSELSKASQMNYAAKVAQGDILFFVHADMQLPEKTLFAIEKAVYEQYIDCGGFANIFDQYNDKIKRIGSIMNLRLFDKREQSDKGIFYGDNGIFVKKVVFEKLGGFKNIPIMEDYDFSARMGKAFQTKKIYEPKIVISARRHIKTGFVKTRFLWIAIRALYKWGISPFWLAKMYKHVR